MNYLKVYCNLIRKAQQRQVVEGYVEKHHIFPVSIFGKNNKIVVLTGREHYISHALLEKIYLKRYGINNWKTKKMIFAYCNMNAINEYHNNSNNSNKVFIILGQQYFRLNHYCCQSLNFWKNIKCTRGDADNYRERKIEEFDSYDLNDVEDFDLIHQNKL